MATVIQCDKCGRELVGHGYKLKMDGIDHDLCNICYNHLKTWLNKKEKGEKSLFKKFIELP